MIYPDQSFSDVPKDIRNVNQHPYLAKHALASRTQKRLNNFLSPAASKPVQRTCTYGRP